VAEQFCAGCPRCGHGNRPAAARLVRKLEQEDPASLYIPALRFLSRNRCLRLLVRSWLLLVWVLLWRCPEAPKHYAFTAVVSGGLAHGISFRLRFACGLLGAVFFSHLLQGHRESGIPQRKHVVRRTHFRPLRRLAQ
jgi:hypothetical protein